jgi:hypothetical protein
MHHVGSDDPIAVGKCRHGLRFDHCRKRRTRNPGRLFREEWSGGNRD